MLLDLKLTAFKCFAALRLPLRPLTLLAGVNGGGKSTVLQALVLLHQALGDVSSDLGRGATLPLNGPLVALGTVRDVIDKARGGRRFGIGLTYPGGKVAWEFKGERDQLVASLVKTSGRSGIASAVVSDSSLFPAPLRRTKLGAALFRMMTDMRYIPADRIGPAEVYPLLEPAQHKTLGHRAELAVGAMYWDREEDVITELRHPSPKQRRLDRQVEAWLSDLFPGAVLEVQRVTDVRGVPTANLATLGIRTNETTDFHRPQHVGFGMTYVFPILVALLSSRPGDLILIENPEAHLHPRAQVRIAELCARAATAGIQVLLETHSDHVLNGVRVAVNRRALSPTQVALHFFGRPHPDGAPNIHSPSLDTNGRLDERPAGFFDEIERQLSALIASPKRDA